MTQEEIGALKRQYESLGLQGVVQFIEFMEELTPEERSLILDSFIQKFVTTISTKYDCPFHWLSMILRRIKTEGLNDGYQLLNDACQITATLWQQSAGGRCQ